MLLHQGMQGNVVQGGQRTHPQGAIDDGDALQAGNATDVHDDVGLVEPMLHVGNGVGAAGDDLDLAARLLMAGDEGDGFVDGDGEVGEEGIHSQHGYSAAFVVVVVVVDVFVRAACCAFSPARTFAGVSGSWVSRTPMAS